MVRMGTEDGLRFTASNQLMARNDSTTGGQAPLTAVDVLLVDDDEQWARATTRLLESTEDAFNIEVAHSLAEGRERFDELDPDCVICDYQLGDGVGLGLLETVRETDADRPFILVTGRGDESVASDAIGRGVTDYIPKANDDTDATLLANRVRNAVVSAQARQRLDRERRGKAATLDMLTSTTNMADLSAQFCCVLVEDHGYAGAWIGTVDDAAGGIVPQAVAGCETYLDAITDSGRVGIDCGDPVAVAAKRDEPVAISLTAPVDGGWEAVAHAHDLLTAVGMPITHDGVRVGMLGVYCGSNRSPLAENQRELLEEYTDIIGHAHRTAELKRSLAADQSTRLDIEIADTAAPLAELTDRLSDATVTVLSTIKRDDGSTLYLTQVPEVAAETLQTVAADCQSVRIESISETDDGLRCDLVSTARTPVDVLASHGATVKQTIGENGSVTVSVSLVDHHAVSTMSSALRAEYESVTIKTVWNDHTDQPEADPANPITELTDKQRDVVRHAYFDGYFEQPRGVSATELAEKFDLSRPTMTQHLRAAQRNVFHQLFEK